jgi:hypothetical protein
MKEERICMSQFLIDYLAGQEPGCLQDTAELERHLAACWGAFEGQGCEGIAPAKLLGRLKQAEWSPPFLRFVIERHGGTCLGSTRAERQRWTLHLAERTASCETVGHRQLRPMAARVSVLPLAEAVAQNIIQGQEDGRLVWRSEGQVKVVVSALFPTGSGFKQTVEGRRKRFMQALVPPLERSGWRHVGRGVFSKAP